MVFSLGKSHQARALTTGAEHDMVAFFEPGVDIEGKISFTSGVLRLNSHCKGEIKCDGTVVIGDQGEVEGEIQSRVVSIAGKVKGIIHAIERLEIKGHGVVLGDIHTPALVIEPGGYFAGNSHMPNPEPGQSTTDTPAPASNLETKSHA